MGSLTRETRSLIFDEGKAKWLVSGVRVNRGWSPRKALRDSWWKCPKAEGCTVAATGFMTIDPRPFTATQRAVNETAARYCRRVRRCWTSRLRHGMQNDPIIAAGGTGILGSRDERATLIRILHARDEGATGAG